MLKNRAGLTNEREEYKCMMEVKIFLDTTKNCCSLVLILVFLSVPVLLVIVVSDVVLFLEVLVERMSARSLSFCLFFVWFHPWNKPVIMIFFAIAFSFLSYQCFSLFFAFSSLFSCLSPLGFGETRKRFFASFSFHPLFFARCLLFFVASFFLLVSFFFFFSVSLTRWCLTNKRKVTLLYVYVYVIRLIRLQPQELETHNSLLVLLLLLLLLYLYFVLYLVHRCILLSDRETTSLVWWTKAK